MLETTCHCGAVRIAIPHAPRAVTDCTCSICRRYGVLWAYFAPAEVQVEGESHEYSWGPATLAFVRCASCGCLTHWRPLARRVAKRMGVNIRNFSQEQIGPIRMRFLEGAVSERYVAEVDVAHYGALALVSPSVQRL